MDSLLKYHLHRIENGVTGMIWTPILSVHIRMGRRFFIHNLFA